MIEYWVFLLCLIFYFEIFVLMVDNVYVYLRNIEFFGQVVIIYLNNFFWNVIFFFLKDKFYVIKYLNVKIMIWILKKKYR